VKFPGPAAWRPAHLVATWFGSGYLPIAPGTWGSALCLPVAWLIAAFLGWPGLLAAAALALAAGLWATAAEQRRTGEKDAGRFVIDEVAGQWIAVTPAIPPDLILYAAGFFAFRFFDIAKPWPAGWCDSRLPGAPGVMLDDIVAGFYAALMVYGLSFLKTEFGFA
jgi:phosphatidylglycerophosphatase A